MSIGVNTPVPMMLPITSAVADVTPSGDGVVAGLARRLSSVVVLLTCLGIRRGG